jgi:hypothetical protein
MSNDKSEMSNDKSEMAECFLKIASGKLYNSDNIDERIALSEEDTLIFYNNLIISKHLTLYEYYDGLNISIFNFLNVDFE